MQVIRTWIMINKVKIKSSPHQFIIHLHFMRCTFTDHGFLWWHSLDFPRVEWRCKFSCFDQTAIIDRTGPSMPYCCYEKDKTRWSRYIVIIIHWRHWCSYFEWFYQLLQWRGQKSSIITFLLLIDLASRLHIYCCFFSVAKNTIINLDISMCTVHWMSCTSIHRVSTLV